jgi:NAD(P)-dependent dehydrogenase (short-subunit alcohol dehydrogenase family)
MPTYLVTGASRGIGLEFCRQLRARGDDVVAVCRSPTEALHDLGVDIVDGVDVTEPAAGDLAGRLRGCNIDALINNAGVLRRDRLGSLGEESVDDILLQFRTNSLAPLLVTEALLPNLRGGSKVAIVTSRMGSVTDNTSGGYYGYRMSKAAVNIAGVSLARDLADRKIAVALLHPGYVRTDMTGHEGFCDADEAVGGMLARIDGLTMENTGGFWHANGETLAW